MPRLKLDYTFQVSKPTETFNSIYTSWSASYTRLQRKQSTNLSSYYSHAKYHDTNITETVNPSGYVYLYKEVQQFFYDSLKDAISKTEIDCVCDDSNQCMTIFGVKIFPFAMGIGSSQSSSWHSGTAYGAQHRIYPIVLKDGDRGVQINSFGSHAFDNGQSSSNILYNIINNGHPGGSNAPDFWGQGDKIFEQAGSMIRWARRTYSNINEACVDINDIRLTLFVYYNTDYILVNYRGHGNDYELPLFCIIKGTIQNQEKTSIAYCCANPNDVRTDVDYRNVLYSVQSYSVPYSPCHTLFIPDYPDVKIMPASEKIQYSSPAEARFCNTRPYFIDWRAPNYQISEVVNCEKPESTESDFFRKQSITGLSGLITFSDNIVYADENCLNGKYYEIDGEQYWCPSNSSLDYYVTSLGTRVETYYRYSRRVLFKL